MHRQFDVKEQQSGMRLDRFLVEQFPERSRSQLQQWCEAGVVTVNQRTVSKHHFLRTGDVVVLTAIPEVPREQVEHATSELPDVPMVFEDEQLIVVNKPTGVLVHPTEHEKHGTVVDVLLAHFPQIAQVGDDPLRPGIVQRLDREVSGVMVVAKTQEAFQELRRQFAQRLVEKEYRAIVHGVPSQAAGEVKLKIAHSATQGGKMAARPLQAEGKEAWTAYEVLSVAKRYSVLRVKILTGRTHQIRAHLAAIGHPVVGDQRYASKRYATKTQFPRLFLHAYQLTITHPRDGKQVTFQAPIPEVFDSFLST